MLGLGDVRVLDRERSLTGGGRLDLLLLDEDNDRRYEVEIQLGATDPSHIIRSVEYWDLERRRYPAYEHVAVIIAEDITSRFLNVMSLMSGSIPMIAIQLDALQVQDHIILNFLQVLDLTDLRSDDTVEVDTGGGNVDRSFWVSKAGSLLPVCDSLLEMVNHRASNTHELNYLKNYIGFRVHGVVRNTLYMSPKPTKNFVNISMTIGNAQEWKDKYEERGIPVQSKKKNKMSIKLSVEDLKEHRDLIEETVHIVTEESGY